MEENLRKEKSRLSCVDLARGIGILAIVYGHASRDVGLLARAVYSFHVVLFVLLSGYVYRQKDSFGVHLKTSARRLLVPYVIWSFISMGIYLLLGKIAAEALGSELYSLGDNLIFMLKGLSIGNAALWYLPFLFTSGLLMYGYIHLLQRWNPEKPGEKVTAVAFPALFSLVTLGIYSRYQYRCPIDFPFGINNACFLFVFFFLGLVLRRTVTFRTGKKWLLPSILLILLSIGCALTFNDEVEYMSFDHSEYGRNIVVFFLTAGTTSVGILWFSAILGKCRLMQWFGRNSMAILVMHKFPVLFFQVLLGDLPERLGNFQFLAYLSVSFISMVLCCWVGLFLQRFLPWTLGEKKK